jgi:hypothetical protein
MLVPVKWNGGDAVIPANFAIDLPDDTQWVGDAVEEVLSIVPLLFRSCGTKQQRTLSISGNVPVRLMPNNIIAVGRGAIHKYRCASLKAPMPAP